MILVVLWLPGLLSAGTLFSAATAGYIYGFPLVLMGETFEGMTGPQRSCQLGADVNRFVHVLEPPGPDFKAVVRPNVDTLYSSAMLDLSRGPVLLDMPAVTDRYVLMALLDAWSNNFAGVGTQTHGATAGHYAITGPGWSGGVPMGYERIDAPTDLVWIVGRTELRDESDVSAVNRIQHQYQLTPLAGAGEAAVAATCVPDGEKTPHIDVVKSLSGRDYFQRLADLMARYPPPPEDDFMVQALQRLGIRPDTGADSRRPDWRQIWAMNYGRYMGQASLGFATDLLGFNGWGPNPKLIPLGDYGKRYFIRAVVAQVGFGANRGEFAVYQNASRDARLRLLSGQHQYRMTFKADEPPPVNAFWSITVYGEDGFLRDNPVAQAMGLQRYALGSSSDLVSDEQGNVSLYFASVPPPGIPLSNWLPVPEGVFQATIRLYDPAPSILRNDWRVPAMERLD